MTRISLPPEAFYWAIVDGVGLRRPGPLPPGLRTLAADDIPVDIDTLHAVGTMSEQGSIVVCALEREQLEALGPDVVSLTPSAAPPGIEVALSQLELLAGQFEPRSVRRRRTRRHVSLAIVLLLCSVLIATGLTRR
ncbi:MAG TPA: hypothetical protein ENK57_03645, partial [Polyangiaceae bacterium]|nr:hypothetical protein [Polyangiaceae bacterium]